MKAIAFVLAVAALLPAGLSSAAPRAADPKTMVLRPADMPAGYERQGVRYVSNAQASREAQTKKDYTRLGRLRGYEATYEKQGTRGILAVVSRASVYKTAAGARESMSIDVRGVEQTRKVRFRRLPLATTIGDEARLYTATVTEGGTKVDTYSLAWRSGTVYAALTAGAPAGTGKAALVVTLARRQQARIAGG